jgi:hypothetical protein
MSFGGIKRTALDAVFSNLVRERADYTCQVCGKEFPGGKGNSPGLHASHFFGRRGQSTRFHGDNVYAHCFSCHQRLGGNPHEFSTWVKGQLGETRYDELVLRANAPLKRTKAERKEMLEHFKAQLAYIERRRREKGETGLVEFVEWD